MRSRTPLRGGDPESPRDQTAAEGSAAREAAALMTLARKAKDGPPPGSIRPARGRGRRGAPPPGRLVPTGFDADETGGRRARAVRSARSERAARSALTTSADRARAVVEAMAEGDGAFHPFVGLSDDQAAAHDAARRISRELEPSLVAFANRPGVIVQLARSSNPAAKGAVVHALSDPDETVQRTTLSAIGSQADPGVVREVSHILAQHESWAMRVLAAEAMGRLGSAGARGIADSSLRQAATHDSYALVREAALRALASFDAEGARPLARVMAGADAEPRVREGRAANRQRSH